MAAIPSKLLGLEQRVGQVDEQTRCDETGKRIVEDHEGSLSKQIAGIDVGD
jgi:hypothetical protein